MTFAISVALAVAAGQTAEPKVDADPEVRSAAAEIIVTGERVSRSTRDTPSSVVAIAASDFERMAGADRIDQVLELIPNVQMSSGGEGPTIRGQDTTGASRDLPAFLGGTRPRTTLIVDGRPVSFNEFIFGAAPLWDIERIEVFRSPQTTTQGQNSIAGAIFVNSAEPSAALESRARVIAGSFGARQLSGMVSGPLAEGLAVRAAADYRVSRPASVIGENAVGADPNRDEYGLARVRLAAAPGALPGTRLELIYAHTSSHMPQIEGVQPPFEQRRNPSATYGTFRVNVDALTARLRFDRGGPASASALVTVGDSRARRFAPAGLGQTELNGRDWTAEGVANLSLSPVLRLLGGASHGWRRLEQYINLSQLAGEGRFSDRQTATGLFGEASWAPFRGALITAGLRYQEDAQTRAGTLGTRFSAIPLDFDRTFRAWLPKLSLSYDLGEQVRIGLLAQRGYNPGGVTVRFDTGAPDVLDAESLWDYEAFVRARFAGGALGVSANLFRYDIRNAQRAQPIAIIAPSGRTVTFADLFNLPNATSTGLEAQIDWRPSRRLSGSVGIGLLRTRIGEAGPPHAAFEGRSFGRAPDFSGSLAVAWQPFDRLRLSAQARRNSGYFSDDLNNPQRRIPGWTRLDGRAELNAGRFRLFGYARNALDDFFLTYRFNANLATAGDPRELGFGLDARF